MTEQTPSPEGAQERAPDPEVILTDFCTDLSVRDRRVEMIAGFHAWAVQHGLQRATPSAWAAHYAAFQAEPVT